MTARVAKGVGPVLGRAFRLLFMRIETQDFRRRRLLGILQGAVSGLGNKVVGMVVSFLSVPLTVGYLGAERYGVWVTIGSLMAWLSLTDFGLGNGLTNAITTAAGQERPDLVRMHLSNGLAVMSGIAALVGLTAVAAWPFIDWGVVFGVTDGTVKAEVGPAIAAALVFFLLGFPLSTAGKVYLAFQEGRIGSYWGMAGNSLSLLVLLIVTHTKGGLLWLVIALSGTQTAVTLASNAWVYLYRRPHLLPRFRHVELASVRSLGSLSGKFFLIQIMALVTFQTDNLVISHFLGAASVPQYSLTYSLFSYTSLPQSILFQYLWAAYTEAIARGDIAWVRRTFYLSQAAGMVFNVAASTVLVFIAVPFIAWWAGPSLVPSSALVLWMAAWSIINAWSNPIACLLAAASHLRTQIIYSAFSTVSNLALSIYLAQLWALQGSSQPQCFHTPFSCASQFTWTLSSC